MPHRVAGDVALLLLHQIQRVQDRGLAPIRRIARDDLVELRVVLGRVGERLARLRPSFRADLWNRAARIPSSDESSPVHVSHHDVDRADDGDHVGDQAALTIIGASAWQAMNDGARVFTRHGRFVPSDTM